MSGDVDAFLAGAQRWREEMAALREIALACGLEETMKWGKPCYRREGRNVVLIHGFKDYCALLFFKGAALADPEGLLIRQTENVNAARQIRLRSRAEVDARREAIAALVRTAIAVEAAGMTVPKAPPNATPAPAEWSERLAADPELAQAFQALTPGRRRGYLLHFGAAKQAKTRLSRIEACAPRIRSGQGLDD